MKVGHPARQSVAYRAGQSGPSEYQHRMKSRMKSSRQNAQRFGQKAKGRDRATRDSAMPCNLVGASGLEPNAELMKSGALMKRPRFGVSDQGILASMLQLSVLDQVRISEGSTGAQALRNSVDLAKFAEGLGYTRYWIAEHHGTPALGSSCLALVQGTSANRSEHVVSGSRYRSTATPQPAVRGGAQRTRSLFVQIAASFVCEIPTPPRGNRSATDDARDPLYCFGHASLIGVKFFLSEDH